MQVIETGGVPIKSWCKNCEAGSMEQAKHLARLPFAFHHVCLMPDAHEGYGMPIGGVLATLGMVIPNAVGVDIGCGMCAAGTDISYIDTATLKAILSDIRSTVPLGFAHHKNAQDQSLMPGFKKGEKYPVILGDGAGQGQFEPGKAQIGTLGGGNHFIEIQKGSDKRIWVMVHSGSRNVGKQVCDYHNRLASALNEKQGEPIPKQWQLAALKVDSEEGQNYIREMNWCLDFARANRALMMSRIQRIVTEHTGAQFDPAFDIHHNYAAAEVHFGTEVIVHRKGATSAREGQLGIIPGSQGTKSYIVRGKGNPESFMSCSHGAGRKLGRKEAVRTLNLEEEKRRLDKQGIIHAIRGKQDLEEAASAYKDIDTVMAQQEDLVKIQVSLQPLAVVKG